eukprot:CAMPEP_0119005392 /NCGR_PEP_ID=MMETSP1176-20130426/1690_1 /TAXON_ID=265551 /ORGANISM="Synedropsis recta cf, Strain CCMP1620" /LENGTH=294 /DNA_ID=CAMNT_0006957191 /DNA_START=57 /DNA_END=941 /DNA_ORIENTATION=-
MKFDSHSARGLYNAAPSTIVTVTNNNRTTLFDDYLASTIQVQGGPSSKKKRRRRRNKKPTGMMHFDSSDCSSVSSDGVSQSGSCNNNHMQQQHLHIELSEEEKCQYVALDCEMVGIGRHGKYPSLARVSVIDWDGNTLLDLYVRQRFEVTDYRTFVSGVTEEDLKLDQAVDYDICRSRVQDLIYDKIIVGHALKNDLRALMITHPWQRIRDTAKYEPFMKDRFDDGTLWPRKLKDLAQQKLRRTIQQPGNAHCPVEDAETALDLYKHARYRWEKAMDYKINKTHEIERLRSNSM